MKGIIFKWFYNTTKEKSVVEDKYESIAERQDKKILKFFCKNSKKGYAPSYIHKSLFSEKTPITSVRRSINTLEKKSLLIKTGEKSLSPFGRPENLWKLNIK